MLSITCVFIYQNYNLNLWNINYVIHLYYSIWISHNTWRYDRHMFHTPTIALCSFSFFLKNDFYSLTIYTCRKCKCENRQYWSIEFLHNRSLDMRGESCVNIRVSFHIQPASPFWSWQWSSSLWLCGCVVVWVCSLCGDLVVRAMLGIFTRS